MAGWIYILEHFSGTTVKVGKTKVSSKSKEQDYIKAYKLQGFKLSKTYKIPE